MIELYSWVFSPNTSEGEEIDQGSKAWMEAVNYGFYELQNNDEEAMKRFVDMAASDGLRATGAYLSEPVPGFPISQPVATLGSYAKDLNCGYGRQIPAHLITTVTVRSDFRRRGLLSRMLEENLQHARKEGLAVAALTASEATIYRRFGFGVATKERSTVVNVSEGFQLDQPLQGVIRNVPREMMQELSPWIFAQYQAQQPGSIDRGLSYSLKAAGKYPDNGKADDKQVQAAVRCSQAGTPDGFVSFKHQGWDGERKQVKILDLVAGNHAAYLDLWNYLGNLDLVDEVIWPTSPIVDPLEWALRDRRRVKVTREEDMLWLRILDVPKALGARFYPVDGELVIAVEDSMGLSGGVFTLSVVDGQAAVRTANRAPDLSMNIAELSSLYLGGVTLSELQAAGRVRVHSIGAGELLDRMFAADRPVHCATHF